jgi:hypothetical protein
VQSPHGYKHRKFDRLDLLCRRAGEQERLIVRVAEMRERGKTKAVVVVRHQVKKFFEFSEKH